MTSRIGWRPNVNWWPVSSRTPDHPTQRGTTTRDGHDEPSIPAHSVRFDAEDNMWLVDAGNNVVVKFNAKGRIVQALGRRLE
jgi:hypothetical protein